MKSVFKKTFSPSAIFSITSSEFSERFKDQLPTSIEPWPAFSRIALVGIPSLAMKALRSFVINSDLLSAVRIKKNCLVV